MRTFILLNCNGEVVVSVAENEETAIENAEIAGYMIDKIIAEVSDNQVCNITRVQDGA